MKKLFYLLIIIPFMCIGQMPNLVVNPDFEQGSIPNLPGQISYATGWNDQCTDPLMFTNGGAGVDLLDRSSSNPSLKVPTNLWGSIDERTGDRRYAHLWQTQNAGPLGNQLAGERLKGSLTTSLATGDYRVCFWGARATTSLLSLDNPYQIVEVYLVNNNNCETSGKLILTTANMTYDGGGNSIWRLYCANFTISSSEAGQFNKILFKIKTPPNTPSYRHKQSVYIDEISITKGCEDIVLNLPNEIEVCDNNFEELCGPYSTFPTPIYTYEWWGPHPTLPVSTLLSTSRCFTPNRYGSYKFKITDQNGCTTEHIITIKKPKIVLPEIANIEWCPGVSKDPIFAGWPTNPFIGYNCDYSIQWTFNGSILGGYNDYRILFQGEGVYCVLVTFSDYSVEKCFTATKCCKPKTEFAVSWYAGANPHTITVSNYVANIGDYDSETFYVYKDCNNDGNSGPWTLVNSISRSSNFNTPLHFENLDPNCAYKIVHAVSKICLRQSFIHTEYVGGNLGKIVFSLSPNPAIDRVTISIEDYNSTLNYLLSIYDFSGNKLEEKNINLSRTSINISNYNKGIYFIKVSNGKETETLKLVKE